MDFFKNLSSLMGEGYSLTLAITRDGEHIIVGILPKNPKGETPSSIQSLVLRALPEEMDENFFDKVSTPLEMTKGVMSNVLDYEKSLQKTKEETEKAKSKATTAAAKATTTVKTETKPVVKPAAQTIGLFDVPQATATEKTNVTSTTNP